MPYDPRKLKPDDLLTPAEVLLYFPQLDRLGAYPGDIGNFRRVWLLAGDPLSKKAATRVSVASVVRMLRLINYNLKQVVFNFDDYPNLKEIPGPDYGDDER